MVGIAVRNGIMMISHFRHLQVEEGVKFGDQLAIRGAEERLAPILMTALTAALALLPLVVAGNKPGHEIEYPMALVIIGGLLSSHVDESVSHAVAVLCVRKSKRTNGFLRSVGNANDRRISNFRIVVVRSANKSFGSRSEPRHLLRHRSSALDHPNGTHARDLLREPRFVHNVDDQVHVLVGSWLFFCQSLPATREGDDPLLS